MKRTNLLKELTLGVAVVSTAMVLTACGSKDEAKTTENKTTVTQTTQATQNTQTTQTTQETQKSEEETKIKKVEVKDGEFINVFPEKYDGEFIQIGDYYFGYNLVGTKYTDIEDYNKNEYDLYFKREGDKEYTVIQHFNFGSVSMHSVYSDGKEVLYGYDNKLCRYNIETGKNEEIDLYKVLDNISEKSRNRIYVMGISNGNAYINFIACDIDDEGKLIGDSSEPIDFVITYNFETKTASCAKTGRTIKDVIGEYVITYERKNEFKGEEKIEEENDSYMEKYFVEKATEDGIKEVIEIGNKTVLCDNNKEENEKIYFETNITDDEKAFTLTSFDKESNKLEKVADLKADMFGKNYESILIVDVANEYCTISAFEDSDATKYKNYKYTYATGDIEEISEETK